MDVGEKRVDRISSLPAGLRELILEHLPIQEAIRTSVLSTSWEYTWTRMRKLNFDLWFDNLQEFRSFIDKVLMLHTGNIQQIILLLPEIDDLNEYVDLQDWCYVLSEKGIQEIDIDASNSSLWLPRSFFRCTDLKKLALVYCDLYLPRNFTGFNKLVHLELRNCMIPPRCSLESWVSQSPELEYVSLNNILTSDGDDPVVISSSNLRTFRYLEGRGTVIFKNVPKLTSVTILWEGTFHIDIKAFPKSWDSICSLTGLKELVLDTNFLIPMRGNISRCFPTRFENLITLSLRRLNACVKDDICFVICWIRSSPGLQHLTLVFNKDEVKHLPESDKSSEEALKLLETEATDNCKLSNISTASFQCVKWSRHEIMLIKVLLSRCPNIKSFKITPYTGERTEEGAKNHISKEFEGLPNMDKLVYLCPNNGP